MALAYRRTDRYPFGNGQSNTTANGAASTPPRKVDWSFLMSGTSAHPHHPAAEWLLPTSASAPDYQMALLQLAADQSDEAGYLAAYRQIDWAARSAADILLGVQLALQAPAHGLARELSRFGAERYPDHGELQKYARILAPPRTIASHLPPRPDLRANHVWIKQNSTAYRGRWVALQNGQLLASAASLRLLADQFPDRDEVVMTKIY